MQEHGGLFSFCLCSERPGPIEIPRAGTVFGGCRATAKLKKPKIMTVKKMFCAAIALSTLAIVACEKEPSTSDLHEDYLVYTAHDTVAEFPEFDTYYLPDRILLIGGTDKAEYWDDERAQQVVAAVAAGMDAAGYTRVADKELADLGLQMSYVRRATYFIGYDNPYWWWYYPYYWTPGYWGDWTGWYYPFHVHYGYTSGSMLIEMLDLVQTPDKKLPVVWNSFIGGLLTSDADLNLQRMLDGVKQAFAQSPYLLKSIR